MLMIISSALSIQYQNPISPLERDQRLKMKDNDAVPKPINV